MLSTSLIRLALAIVVTIFVSSCALIKDKTSPTTYFSIDESPSQFCPTNVLVNHKVFAKNTNPSRAISFNFVSAPNPVTLYPGESRQIGCTLDPVTQRPANYTVTSMTFVDVTYGDQHINDGVVENRHALDAQAGFEYTQCKQEAMIVDKSGALVCDPEYKEKPWWKIF